MYCKYCNRMIANDSESCVHCGKKFEPSSDFDLPFTNAQKAKTQAKVKKALIGIGIALAVIVAGCLCASEPTISMLFVADIIITAAAYMAIPIIYTTYKIFTIDKSSIQKAVIINAVCAWFIFAIIAVNQGRTPGAAGVLWASVCYFICKKIAFEK